VANFPAVQTKILKSAKKKLAAKLSTERRAAITELLDLAKGKICNATVAGFWVQIPVTEAISLLHRDRWCFGGHVKTAVPASNSR